MNIRNNFNRLAAGLSAGLVMGFASVTATAEPIVPPGSNPDFLPQIYEHLTARSSMPNTATLRVNSSVTNLTTIPDNQWLRDLKNLHPEDAEAEVQGCLASFCEYKYPLLNTHEKFVARLLVMEAMFHNGLNEEEFRTYSQFVSSFQPHRAFQEQEDALIESLTDRIMASPEYNAIKQNIVPAARINQGNAEDQFRIRIDFINFVTREVRAAYGFNNYPSWLDKFPPTMNGTGAVTISKSSIPALETTRALLFNYNSSNTHSVESLLDTSVHEARHSVDFDYRDMAYNRQFSADDPRFSHSAIIHMNNNLYIPLCATRTFGSVSCPQQYEWYKNQYIERSAQDFANKLIRKFREKLQAREQLSSLRGLEPHKLELPA